MRSRNFNKEVLHARKYSRDLGVYSAMELPFLALDHTKTPLDAISLCYIENSNTNQLRYYSAFVKASKISQPVMSIWKAETDLLSSTIDQIKATLNIQIASLQEPFHSFYKNAANDLHPEPMAALREPYKQSCH